MKANLDIRREAKSRGIKHWQIAEHIGVSDQTIMRWLRVPLTEERKKVIMEAIDVLAKGEC
jgi:transposase